MSDKKLKPLYNFEDGLWAGMMFVLLIVGIIALLDTGPRPGMLYVWAALLMAVSAVFVLGICVRVSKYLADRRKQVFMKLLDEANMSLTERGTWKIFYETGEWK